MADGIEQKLDMSLDDLAMKEKQEEMKKYRRGGLQWQQGRSHGFNRAGWQRHQWRELLQSPPYGAPDGAYMVQKPDGYSQMRPAGGMRQQNGWQSGGRVQGGPSRRSVFSRLTDLPQQPYHQLPQHIEPLLQQQYAQYDQQQPAMSRQQQPFQQSIQLRPSPQPPAPQPKLAAPDLQCRVDKATGLVIIQHRGTGILKVTPAGDVTLDSGGDHSSERLAAINTALSHIDMSVKEIGDNWSISDGKGLLRFADGVKMPAKGPLTAGRAMVLLQALTAGHSKAAATVAHQASMQAAIAAGIVPRAAAAAGPVGAAVVEGLESAAIRRLKAQGRYAPY